jgi:hypothetical protein
MFVAVRLWHVNQQRAWSTGKQAIRAANLYAFVAQHGSDSR